MVRKYDSKLNLSEDLTHNMAIDCMDMNAKIVADKVESAKIVHTIEEAINLNQNGMTPILITSGILKEDNPFESSWNVTSDSISAYIAELINAKLLIVTNVNGIYTREPSMMGSKLIKEIDARKLLTFEETSVDLKLPSLLLEFGTNCYVVNGKYPKRVLSIVDETVKDYNFDYTKIIGDLNERS